MKVQWGYSENTILSGEGGVSSTIIPYPVVVVVFIYSDRGRHVYIVILNSNWWVKNSNTNS